MHHSHFGSSNRLTVKPPAVLPYPGSGSKRHARPRVCSLPVPQRACGAMGRGCGPLGHRAFDATARRLEREFADLRGGSGVALVCFGLRRGKSVAVDHTEHHHNRVRDMCLETIASDTPALSDTSKNAAKPAAVATMKTRNALAWPSSDSHFSLLSFV